jgi:hypothetical protein
MEGCGNRVLCRNVFKKLHILPFDNTISIIFLNVVQNKNLYLTNIDTPCIDTKQISNLNLPQANLTTYQKAAYYLGVKISKSLALESNNIAGNQQNV